MSYIDLPSHSRIWVYQSSRPFEQSEITSIKNSLDTFIVDWNHHGEKIVAAADVFYDRFIVFFADERVNPVGGCSIDKSVALLKSFEEKYNVDLFDRTLVYYKSGEEIVMKKMNDFWAMRKAGIIDDETVVFNNLISTKAEFEKQWVVPFKESWHAEMW